MRSIKKGTRTLLVKPLESFETIDHFRQSHGHRLGLVHQVVQLRDLVLLLGVLDHLANKN